MKFSKNKVFIFVIFISAISLFISGCEFEPESEKQSYYTPTVEQIKAKIFTSKGTTWGVSIFSYYSTGTTEHKWQQSNKGSGYEYSFSSDFMYSYQRWQNDYEYVWSPYTTTSYSGKVEIYDGKMIFHGLFGEPELEKTIQFSENGEWIKIGNSAYKREY